MAKRVHNCRCQTQDTKYCHEECEANVLTRCNLVWTNMWPPIPTSFPSLSLSLLGNFKSDCVNAGHYVSFIKSHDKWLFFDDESVEAISEAGVQSAFGTPQEYNNSNMDHGYILMYNRQVLPGSLSHACHSIYFSFSEACKRRERASEQSRRSPVSIRLGHIDFS